MKNWKSQLGIFAFLIALAIPSSGCALFLLGAGAAGGYAISKDEIEGLMDNSYNKVWQAAREVIKKEGAITLESPNTGKLEAIVDNSTVNVSVEQATSNSVRLRVQARKTKGLFPDQELAQDLYTQITKKL
jgi:hypothetical protein